MRTVAAFDFDGTLIRGDSLIPFLSLVAGRRRVAAALGATAPSLGWALAGRGDRDVVKAAVLSRVLAGLPVDAVEKAGSLYAAKLVEHRLRREMVARLGWHRDQGHDLVLVSASLAVYLEPLGDMLGFDQVLATGLEVVDGVLTGGLVGANVRGPEKAARLRAWLEGEACHLYAYGDSAGDHDLFALAQSAFLVGRRGMQPWPPRTR